MPHSPDYPKKRCNNEMTAERSNVAGHVKERVPRTEHYVLYSLQH
jgi:hypothetical protein